MRFSVDEIKPSRPRSGLARRYASRPRPGQRVQTIRPGGTHEISSQPCCSWTSPREHDGASPGEMADGPRHDDRGALAGRDRRRRRSPRPRRRSHEEMGQPDRCREPGRRERQHRPELRRQGQSRRLHLHRLDAGAGGQQHADLQVAALQSVDGFQLHHGHQRGSDAAGGGAEARRPRMPRSSSPTRRPIRARSSSGIRATAPMPT